MGGLGEWIGIELYNELIKTRHNGAVIGKRYFRCPPHRGIFVRRSLIKENIAVLEIEKEKKKLRAKEKKLREAQKKGKKSTKKDKNESKRESKRLKNLAKYAGTPKAKKYSIDLDENKKTKRRNKSNSTGSTLKKRPKNISNSAKKKREKKRK